jgi:hypothetical protein
VRSVSTIGIVVWNSVTTISLVFIPVCSHYWSCETFRSSVIAEWQKVGVWLRNKSVDVSDIVVPIVVSCGGAGPSSKLL